MIKMDKQTVKKGLEELGEKYSLPIKELNKELEIVDIFTEKNEMPDFPIRTIRRRLMDVFSMWINFLHSFLFPSPQSIILTKEAEAFDEKEKDEIYGLLVRIVRITREGIRLEIKKDESKDSDFIKQNFEEYKKIKKEIEKYADKNVEFWKKESEKK